MTLLKGHTRPDGDVWVDFDVGTVVEWIDGPYTTDFEAVVYGFEPSQYSDKAVLEWGERTVTISAPGGYILATGSIPGLDSCAPGWRDALYNGVGNFRRHVERLNGDFELYFGPPEWARPVGYVRQQEDSS